MENHIMLDRVSELIVNTIPYHVNAQALMDTQEWYNV